MDDDFMNCWPSYVARLGPNGAAAGVPFFL